VIDPVHGVEMIRIASDAVASIVWKDDRAAAEDDVGNQLDDVLDAFRAGVHDHADTHDRALYVDAHARADATHESGSSATMTGTPVVSPRACRAAQSAPPPS